MERGVLVESKMGIEETQRIRGRKEMVKPSLETKRQTVIWVNFSGNFGFVFFFFFFSLLCFVVLVFVYRESRLLLFSLSSWHLSILILKKLKENRWDFNCVLFLVFTYYDIM